MVVKSDELIRDGSAPLWKQISDSLVSMARDAGPGSRLPSERQLCERFHVQRGTVQKAIDHLVARRLLTRSPQLGTFVAEAPSAATVALMQFHLPAETDPIYLSHVRGVCAGLEDSGRKLLPLFVLPDGPSEDAWVASLRSMSVAGVIVDRFAVPADVPLITRLNQEFSVVAMNKEFVEAAMPCAQLDPFQSTACLVRYLAAQNVRTMIMFGGHPRNMAFRRRGEAFVTAAITAGHDNPEVMWADAQRLASVLDTAPRPVGVHALTSMQAQQVIALAEQRGMVLARDLFIGTYRELPGMVTPPGVARAVLDEEKVGFAAARLLLRHMEGKADLSEIINVPCEIILPPASGNDAEAARQVNGAPAATQTLLS